MSSKSQLTSLRSTLPRRTEPSLPRSRGATFFRGKSTSGSASPILTMREIGFLNQLAKVSSSPTGILAPGIMETVLISQAGQDQGRGIMSIATANQTLGG